MIAITVEPKRALPVDVDGAPESAMANCGEFRRWRGDLIALAAPGQDQNEGIPELAL